MKCNYKKVFFFILLFVFVVTSTSGEPGRGGGRGSSGSRSSSSGSRSRGSSSGSSGGSSGGGFFSRLFGSSKSSSSSSSGSNSGSGSKSHSSSYDSSHGTSQSNTGSYPKQTYSTGSHSNTNYGWNANSGGNKYNSGHGHYYNSPSSSTNWGSTYNSPSYHHPPPQNVFGNFHPVSSGVAPSYHFHRSTSYVPLYIPSSHTYIHHDYHRDGQSTSTSTTNNNPPPPPSEPVVYKEDSLSSSYGESTNSKPTMIVGFNNMIVYGVYENERHFVITVSEDLDEDVIDIPEKFLRTEDSNLFEIVTLKPPTTTTTHEPSTTMDSLLLESEPRSPGLNWRNETHSAAAIELFTSIDKSNDEEQTSGANVDDVLNLYFGDIIVR